MQGMIQTEQGHLWLLFRYTCLSNWEYAAAKIHMHILEGTFKIAIFCLFSHDACSLGTPLRLYHAYAMYYSRGYNLARLWIR